MAEDTFDVLVIGGGMGWKPFVAQELFSFVPIPKIARVARAVALLFRDHGDRYDRTKSRLKFVVDRLGIDECREIVLQFLRDENDTNTDGQTMYDLWANNGMSAPELMATKTVILGQIEDNEPPSPPTDLVAAAVSKKARAERL